MDAIRSVTPHLRRSELRKPEAIMQNDVSDAASLALITSGSLESPIDS